MSDALSIAVGGLNKSLLSVTQRASTVVNSSLTINSDEKNSAVTAEAPDMTGALVGLKTDEITYAANAKVIRVVQNLNKRLLDTIA